LRWPKPASRILSSLGRGIGITNLSCHSDGLMGYRTPNIARPEEGTPQVGKPAMTKVDAPMLLRSQK